MNYQTATGKTISQTFDQYHKDNPEIYQHFVHFALQWLASGARKISSKQIIGRIRWHVDVETKGDAARSHKISDVVTAHYSRKFVSEYPEYIGCFEFRRLRAE